MTSCLIINLQQTRHSIKAIKVTLVNAFVCIALLIDYSLYRLIKSRLISVFFGLLVNMKKSSSQMLWTLISTQAVVLDLRNLYLISRGTD